MTKRQSHVLALPAREIVIPEKAADAKTGFDFASTLRGSTAHFNVYYETSLGAQGQTLADGVLASCETEYDTLAAYFSGSQPASFNIIIAAGIGGAYHYGCTGTDLYCDASGTNVDHTRMLVVAEEVEVFSALQSAGWNCAASNGEGLSRVLATELYPAQLNGFATAAIWLDGGRPDFVNVNDPSDRNFVSTGCSVLFLNYLHYQLGFSWAAIVQAGAPTLAATYTKLTGANDGFQQFTTLLQRFFPTGKPSGVTSDNVFPLTKPAVTSVPLYRYWNPSIGDHFYTTSWAELGSGGYGWSYEGIQCFVCPTHEAGTVPLYRYWNPSIGDHFYTTNWSELRGGNAGWGFERVQCFVYPSQMKGTFPLYRYWNPSIGDHFYTTNWRELGAGHSGWGYEGIQCYVYAQPAAIKGLDQALSLFGPTLSPDSVTDVGVAEGFAADPFRSPRVLPLATPNRPTDASFSTLGDAMAPTLGGAESFTPTSKITSGSGGEGVSIVINVREDKEQ